jgi:rare lipoprotein A
MPCPRRAIASVASTLARAGALGIVAAGVLAGAAAAQDPPTTTPSGGVSPSQPATTVTAPVSTDSLLAAPVDLGGRLGAVLGMPVTLGGSLPSAAGRAVLLQRNDPRQGWVTIATAPVAADGSFTATWTVDRVGLFATRAILDAQGAVQAVASEAPLPAVTVYRAAKATWFGPGLFGRRTACGQRLTRRLRGIAHRSLPCGSIVELLYKGRIVRAPVVDRGPFRRGVRYDLTQATARDLGFRTTDTVGAALVSQPPAALTAARR